MLIDLKNIKAQYPPEYINALGKRDMDNIRAMIKEIEMYRSKIDDHKPQSSADG